MNSAHLSISSDHDLGRQIGALIARQGGSSFSPGPVIGQVQDLLGEDTTLLGPLRDLLQRPGFRRLFSEGQRSVQIGGREALLQDLAGLYHPAVVARLAAVVDGCLGMPAAAAAGTPAGAGPIPGPGQGAPSSWAPPYSTPPPSAYPPPAQPYAPPAPTAPAAGGVNPLTLLLTILASFVAGAVLFGLGWLMLQSRPAAAPSATAGGGKAALPSTAPTAPAAPAPPPPPTPPKEQVEQAAPSNAWGTAADYKFGQLPGGAYPHSCAFTVTDGSGRTTVDKSNLEFWACRDVGGDPDTGYRVVWADGKETTYTFNAGGNGMVVGTNGSTYPMRWSNDSHRGDDIVVIRHQDGATTWIPGNIRPSGE